MEEKAFAGFRGRRVIELGHLRFYFPMSRFVEVADISSLLPGKCRTVVVGSRELAIGNIEGEFFAVDDSCPHAGGSLGAGTLEGEFLVCPLHQWKFKPRDGTCSGLRGGRVVLYATRVVEGHLQVEVDD